MFSILYESSENSDSKFQNSVMGEPSMAELRLLTCIAAGAPESVKSIKPYIVEVSVIHLYSIRSFQSWTLAE